MARNREERPPRKMRPIYIVFCEGETEEMYVHFSATKLQVANKNHYKCVGK